MTQSLRMRLLSTWIRCFVKPRLARITDPGSERRAFERTARLFCPPPFTCYLPDMLGNVPCQWVWCKPCRPEVLLFFHGGAHTIGSPRTHRAMLARLCRMTGMRALLPDMRLAPEHPFPADLEDAQTVWRALLNRGYAPHQIALGGDSSGGGLAFALLGELLRQGQRPAKIFALSPWVDKTMSGESYRSNAQSEILLPISQSQRVQRDYVAGADPKDPRVSPLFADFQNAPPAFLQVAKTEFLRDDSIALAQRLEAQGTKVELDLWGDVPHVWPIFQGWLPEANTALRRIAHFLTEDAQPKRAPAPRPTGS